MKIAAERRLRDTLREELARFGFVPTASKLYRPSPGLVPRSDLVERVRARDGDVVVVTAPAGYGKSTFLAELVQDDPRPTAWASVTPAENDPASLLSYIALALDAIEPVDPQCVTDLWAARSPTIGSPALLQFGAMLASRRRPFTLILDDVDELVGRDVIDTLPVLIDDVPPGSRIALGARTAIPLPVGRLRVRRRLVEVGMAELAFDQSEAATLLRKLGVDAEPEVIGRLVERTEGWPVALYLAALASASRRDPLVDIVDDFSGDHRYLVEYLGDELLRGADADIATFLIEASCFERMSGTLCDDVLERRGSGELLEDLRRRNLLVIPLDDHREWYRFHHLMAEFLQAELTRRDPGRRRAVLLAASEWFDAHGDGDGAVTHAVRGGDLTRAESMVLRWSGRASTVFRLYPNTRRWLATFSEDQIAGRLDLMVTAAWATFCGREPGAAVDWLARASASLNERHPADVHGLVGAVALAIARASIAPLTPAEMAVEARYAYEQVGPGHGHPVVCVALGAAAFMVGDEAEAVRRFREGAETTLDRPLAVSNCLAHLAVVDIEHGRWNDATVTARRGRALLGAAAADPSSVLAVAVGALVETHAGRAAEADADRLLSRHHLTGLVGVAPWLNLQVRIALVRAAIIRGDRIEAAALVDEAAEILEGAPGAVRVAEQLAGLRREVASPDGSPGFGPSSLTTAELRVLRLLPTHLSLAEIADRLYVSRNTVKSHTISVYRKFGTSSRGGAVEIATAAGLLHDASRQD